MPIAKPIIFLSYAKEDRRRVLNIYRALRNAGLNPWMDQPPKPWHGEGILPGQEWAPEIRKRISQAALVLVFLSRKSLAKRGYVQREYRLALDLALEQPPTRISLVPVLLEPCDVPDLRVDAISLRQFQWHPQYRSTIKELVALVSDILAPTPIQFPISEGGGSQAEAASEVRAFCAVLDSVKSDAGSLGPALASCVAAMVRGDLQEALRASWSTKVDITYSTLDNATNALNQIRDPAIATACALVLAETYNRRAIPPRQRSTLRMWLEHNVPEVGAIASVLLTQAKRPPTRVFDWLEQYAKNPDRLRGGQALLRNFITPVSSVARLMERAPLFMWHVFANDPHLAGRELRHASFHHASSRFEKLARADNWRTRETASAIWAADDRVPLAKKLSLLEDPEPRVRFRALEGMLHAMQTDTELKLIMAALLADAHAASETRSLHTQGLNNNECVMVALDDCAAAQPELASFWFSSMHCDVVESLDGITLVLLGLAVVGDYFQKIKHPFNWHYASKVPGWIQNSLLSQRIVG